ncbi:hypothetical protein [Myxococcus sp. NMCA1]|uniref:hypothetical protein n=1 Tax=Myxococcus sp. NMCA1 TaxID=2996785 RepID=UPI0022854CA6|nr:hypothetical protein [Myxococcus sp. NMCA1]WAM28259.1 hypothetical protein OZ403_09100 [Myxococcus sp. NMCA1]
MVVLRAFAPAFDVKAFLERHPSLETDAVWVRGDKQLLRGAHEDSGFTLSLAEAETALLALVEARARLEPIASVLAELQRRTVTCLIDIGMMVGSHSRFTASVQLTPEDLRWFAERGLGLVVSAYPTSDDDDDGENA